MSVNEQTYGREGAASYDSFVPGGPDAEKAADVLARVAARSRPAIPRALELGVGTGRVAIPLAQRGVRVHGVDLSEAMLDVLRGKPEVQAMPDRLSVAVGDMTDPASLRAPDGTCQYDVVYCILGTLTALPDAAAQRRCLAAAASVVSVEGRVLLEMPIPDLASFDADGRRIRHLGRVGGGVWIETARLDQIGQTISFETVTLSPDMGVKVYPVHQRYVWPDELDLMAELAGLQPISRFADWDGAPVDGRSKLYVSQYRRAEANFKTS